MKARRKVIQYGVLILLLGALLMTIQVLHFGSVAGFVIYDEAPGVRSVFDVFDDIRFVSALLVVVIVAFGVLKFLSSHHRKVKIIEDKGRHLIGLNLKE